MSCKGKDFGHKHKIKNTETNIWLHALGLQHREQKEELLNKFLPRQRPATALNRAQILQHQKLHKKAHKKKMYVLGKVEAEENLLKYHSMPDITSLPETYQHTILPMFTACCCRAEFRSRQPTGVVALPHWVYWCGHKMALWQGLLQLSFNRSLHNVSRGSSASRLTLLQPAGIPHTSSALHSKPTSTPVEMQLDVDALDQRVAEGRHQVLVSGAPPQREGCRAEVVLADILPLEVDLAFSNRDVKTHCRVKCLWGRKTQDCFVTGNF